MAKLVSKGYTIKNLKEATKKLRKRQRVKVAKDKEDKAKNKAGDKIKVKTIKPQIKVKKTGRKGR